MRLPFLFHTALLAGVTLTIINIGSTVHASAGATTPFVSVEAESGTLGGGAEIRSLTSPPTTQYSSAELEASGHAYVRLAADGDYVEWTNNTGQQVTFINVRYSIPDAPGGGGIDATLDLYVDGVFRQTLNLTSRQTWLYENSNTYGGNDQNPANGNPRVFFDDRHTFIIGDAIAPGSAIRLQKNAGNDASFYHIDVVDLENPPAPLTQPANSLSILTYGAVANNSGFDSRSAIQNCINAAQSQGKSVWIPEGTFYLKGKTALNAAGVTIEGAGMWYSTIYRDVPLPNDSPLAAVFTLTSCVVRNFAVDANAPSRAVVDGCGGSMDTTGNFWLAENIWTQHTMSGFWASGVGGTVRNCRLTSIWADGCNINNVAVSGIVGNNLTVSNNFVRGTGDDALAINSVNYNENGGNYTYYIPMANATIANNTTIATWGGKGLAIYGGSGHVVKDNYTSDTARYIGLGVGKFGVNGSDLLSATVTGNVVVRSGGNGYQQRQQAMMIGNDGDGQGVGSVVNAYCASNTIIDSLYAAVGLSTSSNIVFQHNTIINPGREGIVVGLYALKPGFGNAIVYSNQIFGLGAGMNAISNNSGTYALITPVPCAAFSGASGVAIEPCAEGDQDLTQIDSGDWAVYPNVNLTGADRFVARIASGGYGGAIEIRLNNSSGTLLGTCTVPTTGGWQKYVNAYCDVSNVFGTYTVCLVFTGGTGKLFNVQHFGFFTAAAAPSHSLSVGNIYAFKSAANGNYVRADAANGGNLTATSSSVGDAEQFQIMDAGGGNIGFLNIASNALVCAENNGNSPLIANRTGIGSWETFTEFDAGGDNVAIRAGNNSKYVSVSGGANSLIANSTTIGVAQSFIPELVSGNPPSTPMGLRGTPGDSQATLTWAAASGANSYNVKRSLTSGGVYTVVATNIVQLAYTDTNLNNGTIYYYKVSGVNPVGQSPDSASVSVVAGALDRLGWVATASSSGGGDQPAKCIDGDISTRWGTGAFQVNGQWLQIDMAGINTVNKIILDAGSSTADYPRGYSVTLSTDGVNWTGPVATGTGSLITAINFTPQIARFVRITQTGSAGGSWWSVHELNVFGAVGTIPDVPSGFAGIVGDGEATLTWNPSATATGYNLRVAAAENGIYSVIATNIAPQEFIATGLDNGTAYYFVVSAVNAAGESVSTEPLRLQPVSSVPPELNFATAGNELQLNWPQDHAGWLLQVQTNSLTTGLGTNWVTLPDSMVTNGMTFPTDPSAGGLFFRLVRP